MLLLLRADAKPRLHDSEQVDPHPASLAAPSCASCLTHNLAGRFKLRTDCLTHNLAGMGCSAGTLLSLQAALCMQRLNAAACRRDWHRPGTHVPAGVLSCLEVACLHELQAGNAHEGLCLHAGPAQRTCPAGLHGDHDRCCCLPEAHCLLCSKLTACCALCSQQLPGQQPQLSREQLPVQDGLRRQPAVQPVSLPAACLCCCNRPCQASHATLQRWYAAAKPPVKQSSQNLCSAAQQTSGAPSMSSSGWSGAILELMTLCSAPSGVQADALCVHCKPGSGCKPALLLPAGSWTTRRASEASTWRRALW